MKADELGMKPLHKLPIMRCARCGEDHAMLDFEALTNPIGDCTHWAPCPVNGQPVLLRFSDRE